MISRRFFVSPKSAFVKRKQSSAKKRWDMFGASLLIRKPDIFFSEIALSRSLERISCRLGISKARAGPLVLIL